MEWRDHVITLGQPRRRAVRAYWGITRLGFQGFPPQIDPDEVAPTDRFVGAETLISRIRYTVGLLPVITWITSTISAATSNSQMNAPIW
jgi:hypothetical protein